MRLSPSESATLYKVGTKKKGNDGNTWIIVVNKNNIKRWQLYKKTQVDIKVKPNDTKIKALDLYATVKPIIQKSNWTKIMKRVTPYEKEFINKIRALYKTITKETGVNIIEVLLPLNYGIHNISHAWDYAEDKIPDLWEAKKPYMIIVYRLDEDGYLLGDYFDAQHIHILYKYKKNLLNFIKEFNKNNKGKIKWDGHIKHTIDFISPSR
jgi:hypothetical protein